MSNGFQRLKVENWLKIKLVLQGILDPVEAQAKETFVNSFGAVNQSSLVWSNDLPGLADVDAVKNLVADKFSSTGLKYKEIIQSGN